MSDIMYNQDIHFFMSCCFILKYLCTFTYFNFFTGTSKIEDQIDVGAHLHISGSAEFSKNTFICPKLLSVEIKSFLNFLCASCGAFFMRHEASWWRFFSRWWYLPGIPSSIRYMILLRLAVWTAHTPSMYYAWLDYENIMYSHHAITLRDIFHHYQIFQNGVGSHHMGPSLQPINATI